MTSELEFKRVSVIGLGYIGLPIAATLASKRVEVVGVDINPSAVDTINGGNVQIVEPGLDLMVSSAVQGGYLKATSIPEPAQVFVIAVPTPFKGDEHEPDLSFIQEAARSIAPVLESGNLVILESTSPIGATAKLSNWLADLRRDLTFPQHTAESSDIRIAYCPERILPGKALEELISNDRVIGGMTSKCSSYAKAFYQIFVTGRCVVATSPEAAEMTKLAENSFRDINIAFANELSMLADKDKIDVWEVISLANRHPRVNILEPGPGVGGHCIAVDPWFLVASDPNRAKLLATARQTNDEKALWVKDKILQKINQLEVDGRPDVSIFGLAFKPDVDDFRESPALKIVRYLLHERPDLQMRIFDPYLSNTELTQLLPNASLGCGVPSLNEGALSVLLVDHREFKGMTYQDSGLVLDFRNGWSLTNESEPDGSTV